MLPSGWPHAVSTPRDSVVVGERPPRISVSRRDACRVGSLLALCVQRSEKEFLACAPGICLTGAG